MTHGVMLGVLGPVLIRLPEGPLTINEPRRRAVMAALIVHHGQTVTWNQLVGLVWGDIRPASNRKALQVYVSKLRQTIAPIPGVAVVTRPEGYLMVCPPDSVDLHVFRRLVAASRRMTDDWQRRDLLRDALGLWRGIPFADASSEGLREWVAPCLEEERMTALEEYYAVNIRLGESAAVLPALTAVVAEHPMREHFVGLLMTALLCSGRHAEAARAFYRLRASLVREMGIEPSKALVSLHQAILAGYTAADVRPASMATALIARGRAHQRCDDRDRALASLYAARAEARDSGDRATVAVATRIITELMAAPPGAGDVFGFSRRIADVKRAGGT